MRKHRSKSKPLNRELTIKEAETVEIFKVQIPVSTNVSLEEAMCFIYNEDRSIEEHFPVKSVLPFFKWRDGEFKRYMYGYVDDKGTLQLFNLPHLPEQNW